MLITAVNNIWYSRSSLKRAHGGHGHITDCVRCTIVRKCTIKALVIICMRYAADWLYQLVMYAITTLAVTYIYGTM